jgi:hypothetical protein
MATVADVIRQGRQYLGVRYVSGGPAACTASGMDCDCFTKTTYNAVGIPLGWWTDQLNYGTPVAVSNKQPGDLLFFSEDGSGNLTHVGILSYNGYLLHSSSYFGKVVEAELKYVNGLYAARRLVGAASTATVAKYSRVIDNATTGRFRKYSGWGLASATGQYGRNHARALPARANAAWFKFDIPRTADYNVFIRHPASSRFNRAMPFGVYSPSHPYADGSGMVWKNVDLRANGGRWRSLGRYQIPAGDRWVAASSRWSKTSGYVVADAVKITSA